MTLTTKQVTISYTYTVTGPERTETVTIELDTHNGPKFEKAAKAIGCTVETKPNTVTITL